MAKLEIKVITSIIGYTLNVVFMHEMNDMPPVIKECRVKHLTPEQWDRLMELLGDD